MSAPDWNKLRQDGEELPDPFGPDAQPIGQVGDGGKSGLGSLWPAPLGEAAYHGLAGKFLRAVEPHTEADPAALLVQFLGMFGSVVGRGPHVEIDGAEHHSNLYLALVGSTGAGRKGTAGAQARRLFEQVDPRWASERVSTGLSSGEGLIEAVRDPRIGSDGVVIDEGVSDKRLAVFEGEMAGVFAQCARTGNILSPTLRAAWDGVPLGSMRRINPSRATGHHVSLFGHITLDELKRAMPARDLSNGVANRILWVCSHKSKSLPFGGERVDWTDLAAKLRERVEAARHVGAVPFDSQARVAWPAMYERLSVERPGPAGDAMARAPAQVRRLALIYALLDGENVVRVCHLEAALEVWRYCEDSAKYVFGAGGSAPAPVVHPVVAAIAKKGGRTRVADLTDLCAYKRSGGAEALRADLARLQDRGVVRVFPSPGGRADEVELTVGTEGNGGGIGPGVPGKGRSSASATSATADGATNDPAEDGWWPSVPDDMEH